MSTDTGLVSTPPLPSMLVFPSSGVVTTREWTMTGSGRLAKYIYSDDWRIATDADISAAMGVKFHSTERWSLLAMHHDEVLVWIPGCQVLSFFACACRPVDPEQIMVDVSG